MAESEDRDEEVTPEAAAPESEPEASEERSEEPATEAAPATEAEEVTGDAPAEAEAAEASAPMDSDEPGDGESADEDDGEPGDASAVERSHLEALLFASEEPLSLAKMRSVLGRGTRNADLRAGLEVIREELDERAAGFALVRVAGGYQLRTRPDYAELVRKLKSDRPMRLSRPAMETLVVVAYRQPVTRAEIEDIRRVDTGAVLRTLLDRDLVRIVGRKDVPGRPVLYGTTRDFLEMFGFHSLRELPTLKEIKDIADEMGAGIDLPSDILDPASLDEEGEAEAAEGGGEAAELEADSDGADAEDAGDEVELRAEDDADDDEGEDEADDDEGEDDALDADAPDDEDAPDAEDDAADDDQDDDEDDLDDEDREG